MTTAEQARLDEAREGTIAWKKWGPYLSERQWGTVREDYSENGDAWNFFTHDQARSRAYRWGEDGLAGVSDDRQRLCFALALWNERDVILKERLFGLSGPEGNHGEDVKECYYYLDSSPTHSYLKALYKYPQRAFPYEELVAQNAARSRHEPEFELTDTDAFADSRYFDIVAEYAKAAPDRITNELRPEFVDSCLNLFLLEPDDKWRELARIHYENIKTTSRAKYGFTIVDDITAKPMKQGDLCPGYWWSEQMKYYYLLFADCSRFDYRKNYLSTEGNVFVGLK